MRLPFLLLTFSIALHGCADVPPPYTGPCDPPSAEADVTLEDLLEEMVDLDLLAEPKNFRTLQTSSYDRASVDPADEMGWFANDDSGQFDRVYEGEDGPEWVLLDVDGPGVVQRFWTATPQGTLRIYVDCDPEPVIVASLQQLLSGGVDPFAEPYGYVSGMGHNMYFPIPFSEHVTITSDAGRPEAGPGLRQLFYHVGYRLYPDGVQVESLSNAVLSRARPAIEDVAARLLTPEAAGTPEWTPLTLDGSPVTYDAGPGGEAIVELHARLPDDAPLLRSTLLSITFDGVETVRAPIGDFFTALPARSPSQTVAMSGDGDTYVSRFRMPYATDATLRLEGPVGATTPIDIGVVRAPRMVDDSTARFFAKWRTTGLLLGDMEDWTMAEIVGRGHYVGTAFLVSNDNPGWWGEGDEKVWVDDEAFPGIFGTGTEDYFNYAWGDRSVFSRPFHSFPYADEIDLHYGNFALNRFHVMDPIPFDEYLRFDFEIYHRRPGNPFTFDTVSFWYAAPTSTDDFPAVAGGEPVIPPLSGG